MEEESSFKQLTKHLSKFQVGLFVLIIATAFYFALITTPVPNLINSTLDNSTNTTTYKVLYSPADQVPPTFIPYNYSWAITIMVLVLVLSFLLDKQKHKGRMTEQEAKDFIANEFEKKRTIKLPNGKMEAGKYELLDWLSVVSPTYRDGADRKTKYIAIGLLLNNIDYDSEEYWKVRIDPYERIIMDFVQTTEEMMDCEKCPKCGSEFDEKPILAEDLMKMRSAKRFIEQE